MEEKKNKTGMGAAALTLGIISIVTTLFYYISLPTGILGIVLGAIAAKRTGSKLGKAGLITGIVGVSICALTYISMVFLLITVT